MAANLNLIEKLLDAGYSKEEIDKMTAEQNVEETNESQDSDKPEASSSQVVDKSQASFSQDSVKSKEGTKEDDFLKEYKEKIESVYSDLKKATEEVQKFNVRHSHQPEVKKESSGDILYNTIAKVIPPESKGEK